MDQAVQWAEAQLMKETTKTLIAVNPEKIMKAQTDASLMNQLRAAGLLIPDGIGAVIALRLLGLGYAERVPGAELMPRLCALAAAKGARVFLFGGSPDVNRETAIKLNKQFTDLNIAGARHGFVNDDEMPELIEHINSSRTDILFVALGSPKQELWMGRYLPRLHVKICQGVGGTFDVIAGRVKRAPKCFRSAHLEWFYRLSSQPSRLLRQKALPLFAYHILRKRVVG